MTREPTFPVIAVGASAGGLDALERLFASVSAETPAAFLVVQHLSPHHQSLMPELLARKSALSMHPAEDAAEIRPGRVYLLPPGKDMRVSGRRLVVTPREDQQGLHLPINTLFVSMAAELGRRACAIVLSGLGSDGVRGVRAIKAADGLVAVQSPETAQFDGMPESALSTGVVDITAPPEELVAAVLHAWAERDLGPELPDAAARLALDRLLEAVRHHTGTSFEAYKLNTVLRRVERRRVALELPDLASYAARVGADPIEADRLRRELLINVTRFFRDPEVFEAVAREVLPELVDLARREARELRAWVAGCATGEEAYGLSLLLEDAGYRAGAPIPRRIFATDIDEDALAVAGRGVFAGSAAAEIPPGILSRLFETRDDTLVVARSVRDSLVFAHHDVLSDPPLTRIDLVMCRNLLIYLQPEAQQQVLRRLSFALRPGGLLVLGSSETVGPAAEFYEVVDHARRIYRCRERAGVGAGLGRGLRAAAPIAPRARTQSPADAAVDRARAVLLGRYVPPSVLVDERHELVHVLARGFFEFGLPEGPVTRDLRAVIGSGSVGVVRAGLHAAAESGAEVVVPAVTVGHGAAAVVADCHVLPVAPRGGVERAHFALVFERTTPREPAAPTVGASGADTHADFLAEELARTQERLQSAVEQLESSNEELQATNEELVAANEELQSTNEELQSINEELQTVNAEHQAKLAELSLAHADLADLLESSTIGTIFLDATLAVRRFTRAVTEILPLMVRDIGRPILHFASYPAILGLLDEAQEVMAHGGVVEREVDVGEGRRMMRRLSPFEGSGRSVGVVAHFFELRAGAGGGGRVGAVLDALPEHIAVVDASGGIVLANRAWHTFGRENGGRGALAEGASYLRVCEEAADSGEADAAKVAAGLRAVLEGRRPFFTHEYPCHSLRGERWFLLRVAPLLGEEGGAVISHQDITEAYRRRRREAALQDQ